MGRTETKTVRRVVQKHRAKIDSTFNGGVWDEGADGVWAALKPGFNLDGCMTVHVCEPACETTKLNTAAEVARELDSLLSRVTAGPCY